MKKGKVLIVDDEQKIRSLLELYLLDNDYDVLTANNGKTALQLIKREAPDLVVLDILLPDINGLELCKKIRAFGDVLIVYLSCLQESETIVSGLAYGGDDYLTKPFDPNVLVAKINALLRRTRNNRQFSHSEPQTFIYEPLTSQEKQILYWIEKGYTNKEIANKLNLKEGTIKVYNHIIFQKLQVKNRTQAIVKAKEFNLI